MAEATVPASTETTVGRTERGLTIAGTRITLYSIIDYLDAGWPPGLIRDRLNLTGQQLADAMAYIANHRAEVDAEYQVVVEQGEESHHHWEAQNRERFARIAALPPKPENQALREKLEAHKAKLHQM